MDVVDYIPFGKTNAIQRSTLVAVMGLPDRQVRKLIAKARDEGAIIINDQDGQGYYQSDDINDIEHHFYIDYSRAMKIMKRLKTSRRILKAAGRWDTKKVAASAGTETTTKEY